MLTDDFSDIPRQRFYDQQVLGVGDFEREQTFHLLLRELTNRVLLKPGILAGLAVEASADGGLRVHPGAAIDARGRFIQLTDRATLAGESLTASTGAPLAISLTSSAWYSLDRPRTWHLTVGFAEARVENTQNQLRQVPILSLTEAAPDALAAGVALAVVSVVASATLATPEAPSRVSVAVTVDASVAVRATLVPALIPVLDAARLSGTLDLGVLPAIPPAKLSGVLSVEHIPTLPASKLQDGSLGSALFADHVVNGRIIDPLADVSLRSLTVSGRDVLAELASLREQLGRLPPQPTITAVTSPIYPDGEVTITGTGFGTGLRDGSAQVDYESGLAVPGAFRDDGRNYVTDWSDTRITLRLVGADSSGTLVVTARGVPSEEFPFTVLAVEIASATPSTATAHELITIEGDNFGSAPGTVQFPTQQFDGSVTEGAVTTWSNTRIVVAVPADADSGLVSVRPVGFGGWRAPSFAFEMQRPVITSTRPELVRPDEPEDAVLTITGTGFGAKPGQVMLSGTSTLVISPATWSDTEITLQLPAEANALQYLMIDALGSDPVAVCDVIVTSASGASNQAPHTDAGLRSATSIRVDGTRLTYLLSGEPFGAGAHEPIDSASPGSRVLLHTNNKSFGSATGIVTINGALAKPLFWSEEQVQILVPADATSGLVVVTPVGRGPSNGKYLTIT